MVVLDRSGESHAIGNERVEEFLVQGEANGKQKQTGRP
jgi:hypothetical protein